MNVEKYIDDGGVFIKPKCFSKSEFVEIQNKLKNLKLKETHQPLPVYFGNRYQAYPCYESDDKTITELMKIKITELFGRMVKDFNCVVRKTISKVYKMPKGQLRTNLKSAYRARIKSELKQAKEDRNIFRSSTIQQEFKTKSGKRTYKTIRSPELKYDNFLKRYYRTKPI